MRLVGVDEDDLDAVERIEAVIESAQAEFRDYCGRDDIPERAQPLIAELAVARYNRIGAEGLSGQSYSGMTESYPAEYPAPLRQALGRYRKVRFL